MKIFIDIGHGGTDPGAVSTVREKDLNLSVGLHLAKQLRNAGFEVKCSREDDIYLSLEQRVAMANQWGADLFISVHHNAGGGDGAEAYHSVWMGVGKEAATLISEEFKAIGQNVRWVTARKSDYGSYDYYYVIRYTNMPAVITEFAFIDNPSDLVQIDELSEQKSEANAITKAVCKLYGVEFKDAEMPTMDYKDMEIAHLTKQLKERDDLIQKIKDLTKD